jgi:hypothetical protein
MIDRKTFCHDKCQIFVLFIWLKQKQISIMYFIMIKWIFPSSVLLRKKIHPKFTNSPSQSAVHNGWPKYWPGPFNYFQLLKIQGFMVSKQVYDYD